MRFTDKYIKALKARENRFEIGEEGGLYIRVAPSGKKTWVFKYWSGGRWRRYTIGAYPSWSLSEARDEVAKARAQKDRGEDPAQAKQDKKKEAFSAPTVEDFAYEYIERWSKATKKSKSWREEERLLKKDVIPQLGKQKMAEVRRRDIVALLDKIEARGAPVMANRVRACLSRLFNFAIERAVIEYSPVTHIRSRKEKPRDRVLTRQEIRDVWTALDKTNTWLGTKFALEMILRSAQRPGEVLGLELQDIDTERKLWLMPAEKTKTGVPHTVPLTDRMLEIINSAEALSDSAWVFASSRGEAGPVSSYGLAQAIRRAINEAEIQRTTPHDLRRTAATLITEIGFPRLIVDKIINHADRSMGGVYDRHSYDKEKRQALETWERELESIFTGKRSENKVLSFGAER